MKAQKLQLQTFSLVDYQKEFMCLSMMYVQIMQVILVTEFLLFRVCMLLNLAII